MKIDSTWTSILRQIDVDLVAFGCYSMLTTLPLNCLQHK